ncbi:MAG TPA: LLM class flavin-dependent oxidoreductase [Acetobacteraceae bacterium]|jgi:alkanesulfonate monooxygenase SsuD/methylene tetrahydromethanopterin reductase-like flavin-dependent oxidoreductase (luciferase family)|nr:LLM class flavin-dependent oxidoreductase [Acetobacteraceae bacterium]
MAPKLGYLLPTRERIMQGEPESGPILALAARAEVLGFDSVWVGDSLLARPRHEPLTLLAGVAGRVPRVALGTAVLLPALRNPVVLAHLVATLDQVSEGRLILGVGFARDVPNIRAEFAAAGVPFEKRVGRMMEGLRLCRALWSGQAVDWDGRWQVMGGVLAPTPYRAGGPPLWIGGNLPASLERAGKWFDGWFPNNPDAATFGAQWQEVQAIARAARRDPQAMTGAMYLTLALDADAARAEARLNAFLERYYGLPAELLRRRQASYAGPAEGVAAWLDGYARAGAGHLVLRFAGEHERHLEAVAAVRRTLGW